jgi:protoporphyrinogen oxidase
VSSNPSVVVLGGGLSGVGAALALADEGIRDITLIERGSSLGGLAGSFEQGGHFYPLGYHHILHRDRALLHFLDRLGALDDVRWRRVRMFFRVGQKSYDLGSIAGFLRFPMAVADKLRFARLMLRAFRKRDWSDWHDETAAALVDRWAGPGVRKTLFETLTRLKFELPPEEVSGAWLGARLHYREGSAPLGYIPGVNWTKVLCDGLTHVLQELGVQLRLQTSIQKLHGSRAAIREVELAGGERLAGDLFVSSLPPEIYLNMVSEDATPHLDSIRYSALISFVCATRQRVQPDFYWMNVFDRGHTACGIFLLSSLNPSIGGPGETCVNFVTHLNSRNRPLFSASDEDLLSAYEADFRSVLEKDLEPLWTRVNRVPMYSPVFTPRFRSPAVRSTTWENLYFAGNYRTFPSIASTGTALYSGVEAAHAILRGGGNRSSLLDRIHSFRLRSMPSPRDG